MPITVDNLTREKMSKYLTFKQPSMLPTHTTAALPNSSAQNPQNTAEDLISWCVEDIVSKVKEKPLSQEEKKLVESQEFEDSIYKFLVGETLKFALDNPDRAYDEYFAEAIKTSERLEDVLGLLTIETSLNEKLSLQILQGITINYLTQCNSFGVQPDTSFFN